MRKLNKAFYERASVETVAQELLGKKLVCIIDNQRVSGIVTEVEAYSGRNDKACHANNELRTARTEVMYGSGGYTYVYLCYGIHHMLNIVTNKEGLADAVLIRAIEPLEGTNIMLERRKANRLKGLTCGPGKVGQALGLNARLHNGLNLESDQIWLEDAPLPEPHQIVTTTRIGVDYAEEDALKPWRFYIKESQWISKK